MNDVADVAAEVHRRLLTRGETVGTAESLTAGLVGATLTSIAGSSATYRGGLIVYATDLKASLAGVPDDLLAAQGPVVPEVAAALAIGARERTNATWGIGLTGVAGPDPQDGKPVGTVFVALSVAGQPPEVRALMLSGDRAAIRTGAVREALGLLRDRLDDAE